MQESRQTTLPTVPALANQREISTSPNPSLCLDEGSPGRRHHKILAAAAADEVISPCRPHHPDHKTESKPNQGRRIPERRRKPQAGFARPTTRRRRVTASPVRPGHARARLGPAKSTVRPVKENIPDRYTAIGAQDWVAPYVSETG